MKTFFVFVNHNGRKNKHKFTILQPQYKENWEMIFDFVLEWELTFWEINSIRSEAMKQLVIVGILDDKYYNKYYEQIAFEENIDFQIVAPNPYF